MAATSAPKHDRSGTGLGLSIVHEGIEAHGGTVTVTSPTGSGTTFTVRLPLDYVPPEVAESSQADPVAG
jgi:signal transduction histidine kinase